MLRYTFCAMLSLIFVNRFFHPDHSATSQILSDLVFYLAGQGLDVQVVTSRQIYDDRSRVLPAQETVGGVRVHRVWSTRFGRGRLLPRAVDYLTFYLSATTKLITLANSTTIIVAETDPPLISVPCALVARLKRASLVNWIQDLFPEVAEALHVPGMALVSPFLRTVRNLSLKQARANVVLGERMSVRLQVEGILPDKIRVIHNWSPVEIPPPDAWPSPNPLRTEWQLDGKFVVGYSGNFGRAHDFATVLEASAMLRHLPNIHFLFVGAGAQHDWVQARATALGLTNVSFQPYQTLGRLAASLTVPDLHIVSLKAELEGLIVPSKFYSVLAAGRGVLFIGDVHGEIGQFVESNRCGHAFSPGDAIGVAETIATLAQNQGETGAMGMRSHAVWSERFKQQHSLARWLCLLNDAGLPH